MWMQSTELTKHRLNIIIIKESKLIELKEWVKICTSQDLCF